MNKKIKIISMIGFVVIGIVVAVIFGTQKEVLPIGSTLPQLKYIFLKDSGYVRINGKQLIIMYFKPNCPYCLYELEIFDRRIGELEKVSIYLLTTDKRFFADSLYKSKKNLVNAENVRFGLVAESEYKEKFGITATPVFYFFSAKGKLAEKIIGETKFDRILSSVKKAGGAQHR